MTAWMERLVADDWTLDPAIFDYKPALASCQYLKGQLAESWEFTEPKHLCCPSAQRNPLAGHTAGKWPGVYR